MPVDPETLNQHMQHERSAQRQREREELARRIQEGEAPWQQQGGVMSVVTAVRDVEFPQSFEAIRRQVGDREVLTTQKKRHPLREVLDALEQRVDPQSDPVLEDGKVPSVRDFQEIVQHHWEAVRFEDVPEEHRPAKGGAQPQDPRARG